MTYDELIKLSNPSLNKFIAELVMGWEYFEVEYFGDESARQDHLEEWMSKVDLNAVGEYFIDVATNFWIHVKNWKPTENMGQAGQVFDKIKNHKNSWKGPYIMYLKESNDWYVGTVCTGDRGERELNILTISDTLELAVCRAALMIVENIVD